MPRISTEQVFLPGGLRFRRVVKVDSHGTFSVKLPAVMAEALSISEEITGKTKIDVLKEFGTRTKEYEKSKTTTNKVILYEIKRNASIMGTAADVKRFCKDAHLYEINKEDDPDNPTPYCIFCENTELHFSNGIALELQVGVYEEKVTTLTDDSKSYRYTFAKSAISAGATAQHGSRPGGGYHGEKAENRIPWTREREAFFAKIVKAMEGLILQLSEVFESRKKLIALADRGKFLLTSAVGDPQCKRK